MKNKKIFGMPLILVIAGLMIIGGATAALVDYLSNTATMDVEVTSPMSIKMAEIEHGTGPINTINIVESHSTWSEDLTLSTTGLSTIELGVRLENLADVTIADKTLEIVLGNNNSNAECADITSLTFIDVGASEGSAYYRVVQELAGVGLCSNDVNGTAVFSIPINSLSPDTVYKYPVTMTFGNVEPSEYYFDALIVE